MKKKENINTAIVHILTTFNNTIITVSNIEGDVIFWSSTGSNGFRGSRKSTSYAAQLTSMEVIKKIKSIGIKNISINIEGPGNGRELAIKSLVSNKVNIISIKDVTSIPHNGCKPSKKRRI